MKRHMILALVLVLVISICPCLPAQAEPSDADKLYTITLGIEYIENMLVNTYDLICYLDDAELVTLSQGEKTIISVQVPADTYTFSVVGQNKQKSSDEIAINVTSDINFSVSCKAKWNGLSITRFDVASGEDSISMKRDTSLLGTLQDLLIQTLRKK